MTGQLAAAEQAGVIAAQGQVKIENNNVLGENFLYSRTKPLRIPSAEWEEGVESCRRNNCEAPIVAKILRIPPPEAANKYVARGNSDQGIPGILANLRVAVAEMLNEPLRIHLLAFGIY